MTASIPYLIVLFIIFIIFVLPAWRSFLREETAAKADLERATASGRHEPTSIRPWVNPQICIGCGTCVPACPEGKILQIIDGQAKLINGSLCVGHGACARACPVDGIELIFGSAKRGIDIPQVQPDFQTNVPGIYVAGELGGMGLIANAIEQGEQAMDNVARGLKKSGDADYDVVIVGAGPAGLSAAMKAKIIGLKAIIVEQDIFGGAVRHFPRQKIVMSRGFQLPGFRKVNGGTLLKESLISILEEAVQTSGIELSQENPVQAIDREDGIFIIRSKKQVIRAHRVILSVGRRGTPRKLGVPGEDHEKVAYRLLDAELYEHNHILIVGGGDSAVEAAISLSEQRGNVVTLSYRSPAINRPKPKNQERLEKAVEAGAVSLLLSSTVTKLGIDRAFLKQKDKEIVLPNDFVFVFAGGILPTAFLQRAGIEVERHFGKSVESLPLKS